MLAEPTVVQYTLSQTIMLHVLNLYSDVCQLFLQTGKKTELAVEEKKGISLSVLKRTDGKKLSDW